MVVAAIRKLDPVPPVNVTFVPLEKSPTAVFVDSAGIIRILSTLAAILTVAPLATVNVLAVSPSNLILKAD